MIKYLKQGWLVIAIALGFGALLAGVQIVLGPKIDANRIAKTYKRIPVLVMGEKAAGGDIVIKGQEITVSKDGKVIATLKVEKPTAETNPGYNVYKVLEGDAHVGWVVEGNGMGYADAIVCLVGLDKNLGKITGVSVIEQKETPNLGSKIQGPWAAQYSGKSTAAALEVVKNKTGAPDNEKIDAISGATISSTCLTDIVNRTVEKFKGDVAKLKFEN